MAGVVVVGSLNADLVGYAPRLPADGETVAGHRFAQVAGGKGLNQAVAAARGGTATTLIGCVGEDDLGAFLLAQARGGAVDTTGVTVVPGSSGVAVISVDDAATNRIIVVSGANAALDATRVVRHLCALPVPGVILAQLETPLDGVAAAMRLGRAAGAVTVLNPAPAGPLPPDLVADVDWLIPNEHEAGLVLGAPVNLDGTAAALAAARRIQALGPRGVVITLGDRGAVALDATGAEFTIPAFPVTPVDTTAAGDGFCGGFAAALAAGADLRTALHRAAATGALATTRPGAVPSIPSASEVDALLGESPPRLTELG